MLVTAPDGPARAAGASCAPPPVSSRRRLRLLEGEPDQVYLPQVLPMVRERVERLGTNAATLRQTAVDLGHGDLGGAVLEQDLSDQITALQTGPREIRALGAGRCGHDDKAVDAMGPTEKLSPPNRPGPPQPRDIEREGPQR